MFEDRKIKLICIAFLAAVAVLLIAIPLAGKELSGVSDFWTFYVAGMKIRTGHALDLYHSASYPHLSPWVRAPWEALVFMPFTFLPYRAAFGLWTSASVLLFALSGWLLRDDVLASGSIVRRLLLVGILFPVGAGLAFGQDAALFLLLIVLSLNASRQGKDLDAGIWLGIASIKLQLILPLFALVLIRRRWKVLWGICATSAFLFLLSTALAGPGWIRGCLQAQSAVSNQVGCQSVRYLLAAAGAKGAVLPVIVLGIAVTLWLTIRMSFEPAAAWVLVASIFFNWHSMLYDYASALPCIVMQQKRGPKFCELAEHARQADASVADARAAIAKATGGNGPAAE